MGKLLRICVLVLFATLMTGCMTYRDFPTDMVGKPPTSKHYESFSYKIEKYDAVSLGNGEEALKTALRAKTPFRNSESVDAIPAKGIFCMVNVEHKPIPLGALGAAYLSYAMAGITPAWSTKDGLRIRYDLYIDGQKKATYEYEITRKTGIWIGLLPFIWVNALTYSESEAVESTAYKFFQESDPLFAAYHPS